MSHRPYSISCGGGVCYAIVLLVSGCSVFEETGKLNYETVQAAPRRDTDRARQENSRAVELLGEGQPEKAEQALQMALVADVTFGPAHNNLGLLYFDQKKLYLAAWEFDYAQSLMPDVPEVPNNLGLVYEAAGKLPMAIEYFQAAYAMEPQNAEFIGNLVRARIRLGERTPETARLLQELLFYDSRPEWRNWANEQLHTTHLQLAELLPELPSDHSTDFQDQSMTIPRDESSPLPFPVDDETATPFLEE